MKEVRFNPNGGPLSVEIFSGYAQTGAYFLHIWERDAKTPVLELNGDFQNPDDDVFQLPTPVANNDGRYVQCIATACITPPIKDYNLGMKFYQDSALLAEESLSGKTDDTFVSVSLICKLTK